MRLEQVTKEIIGLSIEQGVSRPKESANQTHLVSEDQIRLDRATKDNPVVQSNRKSIDR